MLGGFGLAVLAALAAVGLMTVSGWFIAAMALAGAAGTAINYFTPAALIRLCAILRTGGRYGERLATHDAALRGLARLRGWLLRRLIPLSPARLAGLRSAELFARLRADIDVLEQWYLVVLVPGGVALVGTGLLIAAFAWWLPVALLVVVPAVCMAALAVPALLRQRTREDAAAVVQETALVRGHLIDAVRGHAELLAWGADAAQAHQIMQCDAQATARRLRMARHEALGASLSPLIAQIAVLGVIGCAYPVVMHGHLAPAFLVMLVLLLLAGYELMAPLPEAAIQAQTAARAAERVFALADVQPALREPPVPAVMARPPGIRFRGVALRYEKGAPLALDGVDLDIAPGARVAIVGASGAGKTSLIRALQKFYPLEKGEITFGGQPLEAVNGDDVRRQIAVIGQHPVLFNRSLRENLVLAAGDAREEEIARAVEAAQLQAFVRALPDGYGTLLGEGGVRVSGGEARRITIARALLQEAPVLILDEPTEGLDSRTAQELFTALEAASRGRTVMVVTHRLAGLARLVDEVVTMEAGHIGGRVPVSAYVGGFHPG